MKVFQVVMEGEEEGKKNNTIDIIEYVQADNFKLVSDIMIKYADEMDYELKSIRDILVITRTIYPEDECETTTRLEQREEPEKKVTHKIFSGDDSVDFWRAINALQEEEIRDVLYLMGCRLQELEHKTDKHAKS